MTKKVRILSLILAMLTAGSTLLACSGGTSTPTDTTAPADTTTVATETTEDSNLRKNAKDNLPADLNLNGSTVGWLCQAPADREFSVDGGGEEIGDVVRDAVYNRTRAVEERLNITFKVDQQGDGSSWKAFGQLYESTILSGDCPWEIIHTRGNASIQMGRDHLFQTVEDNKYIDLSQPWWWTDAIEEMSMDGETIRYLMGDVQLDNLGMSRTIYFNKRILESIGQDENELYQKAIDRTWTVDEMGKLTTAAYKDLNGDGTMNEGDQLGMYVSGVGHILAFTFAQDVRHYSRDENNYVYADYDLDRAQTCVEILQRYLYETTGTWYTTGKDNNTWADAFVSGNSLFTFGQFSSAFSEDFRSMEDEYGILPVPLLDENQTEYRTLITNAGTYLVIPVTCTRADEIGAVLEALAAESYRSTIEPYFEVALKTRYASDSASSQCLDIIRSCMYKDFLYEYDLGNCGQLDYTQIINNTDTLASAYASALEKSKTNLQKKYDTFKANLIK